jgi:small subunit ribosomal protein S5
MEKQENTFETREKKENTKGKNTSQGLTAGKTTRKKSSGKSRNQEPKGIRLSKIKYEEKIVQVKRVTKVVKGGKKMTFRAIVIIGDGKHKVGVGIGRADDVNLAIDKAVLNGKKNLINVPLTLKYSVPHVVNASYGACKIMLRPASQGTGVIAGGSVKTVLELAGIKNILAKQFGSKNILNNAKATILALISLNEKVELGKSQSLQKQNFYNKIMRKYKNAKLSN